MSSDNNSSSTIKRRRKRSTISNPLRSHFSSRQREEDEVPGSLAVPQDSIREQTMSFTYRELGIHSLEMNSSASGGRRLISSSVNNTRTAFERGYISSDFNEDDLDEEGEDEEMDSPVSPVLPEMSGAGPSNLGNNIAIGKRFAGLLEEGGADLERDQLEEWVQSPGVDQTKARVRDEEVPLLSGETAADGRGGGGNAVLDSKSDWHARGYGYLRDGAVALPAVALALMLNLLDAMSYGIIIFPSSDSHVPTTAPQAGISMFLASSVISQIVFTCGGSKLNGAVGSMMIEVMPFLHIICLTIEKEMKGSSDEAIIATIMAGYAMSTITTGVLFLLLGVFKLGTIIQFFPRHILIGCIGGIGLFLVFTGIEVTAHVAPVINMEYLERILEPKALLLWGSSLAVALSLKLLQTFNHHTMLVPAFYTMVPIIFYVVVYAMDIPLDELRRLGWLFSFNGGDVPFYVFWTYFDFNLVNWTAIAMTIPTQLALTFFGILHVPINVPALAISTNQDIDLSHELIGHGLSNLASGLVGCTQNYMVYSNSLLYSRCGGDTKAAGVLLIFANILLWVKGTFVIEYVPSIVVGSLIFHLGIDLMKESLYDTINIGMKPLEYLTICIIVFTMGLFGFTEGIVIGVLLAAFFFVTMVSQSSIIRSSYSGEKLRSTVLRPYRQSEFLSVIGHQIRVIKLQGFIFFGTVNQLQLYIEKTLKEDHMVRFFIIDFKNISGVDYSGLETFLRIKRKLSKSNTHLIFTSLGSLEKDIRMSGILEEEEFISDDEMHFEGSDRLVHVFAALPEALEWSENELLANYYSLLRQKSGRGAGEVAITIPVGFGIDRNPPAMIAQTPRRESAFQAAQDIFGEAPLALRTAQDQLPFRFLLQAIDAPEDFDEELLSTFGAKFIRQSFKAEDLIYRVGAVPNGLYILEQGQLGVALSDGVLVETLLPGTLVGELGMLSDRPRINSLVALCDSNVWFMDRATYEELGRVRPDLMLKFISQICLPFQSIRLHNAYNHFSILK